MSQTISRRAAIFSCVMSAAVIATPAGATAQEGSLPGVTPNVQRMLDTIPAPAPTTNRVRMGIYPGGGAGTVDAPMIEVQEDEKLRADLLGRLKGQRSFVLHEYTEIDGTDALSGHLIWVRQQLDAAAAGGMGLELVVRHRPKSTDAATAVAGYVNGIREVVRSIGDHRALVGLQVTNEANLPDAPHAADGAYAGTRAALINGVKAAKTELLRIGRSDVGVGFNVAHAAPGSLRAFFRGLRLSGGRNFSRHVDWVGVDVYPATWGAPKLPEPVAVRRQVTRVLREMRRVNLPSAGLGRNVEIHVSENGFPTGPGRSDADQIAVMTASITAVASMATRLGVSDYRWFDLRDADSSSRHFEHQYGVVRTDGSPKPGFAVLQHLVSALGR